MTFINNTVNKTKNFVSKNSGVIKAVVVTAAATVVSITISEILLNVYENKILGSDDEMPIEIESTPEEN